MRRALNILLTMIITVFITTVETQAYQLEAKDYSVVVPFNYQHQGKSYPLVVCFRSEATNNLLQKYSDVKQSIILQLEDSRGIEYEVDSLKSVIQTVMHEYSVEIERIYLLGVNQNIGKTVALLEKLHYYFAAAAYLTDNQLDYTMLHDSLRLNSSVKLFSFQIIDHIAIETTHDFFLKNYLWAFELSQVRQDASRLNFHKSKDKEREYQLSLSYGQWYFNNSARANEKSLLDIPRNMGAWNFSFSRQLTKSLSAKVNLGILLKKITPQRPNALSVINGANVDVEGGGVFLMPISFGFNYYFLNKRFRPHTGFNVGIVPARFKYVEASGNLANGINRNEYKFNSLVPFIELSCSFTYRFGESILLGMNYDYLQSKEFSENIGGYIAYNGFKISAIFSVVF